LLSNIGYINNYRADRRQIVHGFEVIKKFLINAETEQNADISEERGARVREIRGEERLFNNRADAFGGNFNKFYGDRKRLLGTTRSL